MECIPFNGVCVFSLRVHTHFILYLSVFETFYWVTAFKFNFVGAEKMKSMSQLAVLSRKWRPSEMKLDPFQEVVLESSSVDELKEKVS